MYSIARYFCLFCLLSAMQGLKVPTLGSLSRECVTAFPWRFRHKQDSVT